MTSSEKCFIRYDTLTIIPENIPFQFIYPPAYFHQKCWFAIQWSYDASGCIEPEKLNPKTNYSFFQSFARVE